jgi:hypothetical protein
MGDEQWRVLLEALAFDRDARPTDVHDWLMRLNLANAPAVLPPAAAEPAPAPQGSRTGKDLAIRTIASVSAAILLLGLYSWWKSHDGDSSARPPAAAPSAAVPLALAPPAPVPLAAMPPLGAAASPEPSSSPARATDRAHTATALHAHIALAEPVVLVDARDPAAVVTVLRNGGSAGVASFTWWTADGSAKSGADFDHFAPHVAKFAAGVRSIDLRIPLHYHADRSQAKNFYVLIARSAPDYSPVTRHTTMVKIKAAR